MRLAARCRVREPGGDLELEAHLQELFALRGHQGPHLMTDFTVSRFAETGYPNLWAGAPGPAYPCLRTLSDELAGAGSSPV